MPDALAVVIVDTSILVADDQVHVTEALRLLLKSAGFRVTAVHTPHDAVAALEQERYDAALVDMNYARDTTSGGEGLDLISRIRARDHVVPIVVMTAWSTVPLAVDAMQRGASDFVVKPWDNQALLATLRKQVASGRALRHDADATALLHRDLELAAQLQAQLLPVAQHATATLDCCGRCLPARHVGGDYYDLIPLGEARMALAVADVAGKGLSSAMLMASVQSLLRAQDHGACPDRLVADLNRQLLRTMPGNRFVTMFYGVFDEVARTLAYVNAGHNPPLLMKAQGRDVLRLECGGPVIGLLGDADYTAATVPFQPGDVLVAFTDGITDAVDAAGEVFGDDRLVAAAAAAVPADAGTMVDALLSSYRTFIGSESPADDATVVVVRARAV